VEAVGEDEVVVVGVEGDVAGAGRVGEAEVEAVVARKGVGARERRGDVSDLEQDAVAGTGARRGCGVVFGVGIWRTEQPLQAARPQRRPVRRRGQRRRPRGWRRHSRRTGRREKAGARCSMEAEERERRADFVAGDTVDLNLPVYLCEHNRGRDEAMHTWTVDIKLAQCLE
jgi:hypothetical protein